MCDLAAGQVIVTRPRGDGPAAGAASGAFFRIVERYRSHPVAQLDDLLERQPPPAWERSRRTDPPRQRHDVPFVTELLSVPEGAELSFVEEMRSDSSIRCCAARRRFRTWRSIRISGSLQNVMAAFNH